MAMQATMAAGIKKSNICILRRPMSAATDTTSRLVEVPMLVLMPPTRVAKPMGINMPEDDAPVRNDTLISIGNNNTTMGTLLTKALRKAPMMSVSNMLSAGLSFHRRARLRPSGSSAPVRHQAIAGDHQCAYRHQCFVTKTAEEIHRLYVFTL
jgi:hypothetical protein